jgi:hypothetical protein
MLTSEPNNFFDKIWRHAPYNTTDADRSGYFPKWTKNRHSYAVGTMLTVAGALQKS